MKNKDKQLKPSEPFSRAKERLKGRRKGVVIPKTEEEIPALIQALQACRVELNARDEELRNARRGLKQEIGKRQRAEKELNELQRGYEIIFNSMPDMAWLKDREGRYISVNAAVAETVGRAQEDLKGKKDFEIWPAELARKYRYDDAEVMLSRNTKQLEEMLVDKEGKTIWVETIKSPIYDGRGEVTGTAGIAHDITASKKAEADRERMMREMHHAFDIVSRSQREWQATFDSITDLISIIDKDFTIIRANMACAESYGLHPREIVGMKCYEIVHGCDSPLVNCPHKTTLNELKPVTEEILDPKTKRVFRVSTYPYLSHAGEFIGSIHIARDITPEKKKEEQLIRSEKLASVGELSAGMAHEINNPINFIMANSRLLVEIWEDVLKILKKHYEEQGDFMVGGFQFSKNYEKITKLHAGICDGAVRIKDIVDNLKMFTGSKTIEHLEPVDVNGTIARSLDTLENQIKSFTGRFAADIEEALPNVLGNSGGLQQVIVNLITNALESLPDRTCAVTLSARHDSISKCVVLQVTDQGAGMSQDVIQRALTPFFTTKRERGGIGLGLSISRSIIEDHGGSLEFRSKQGEGTTATVRLPVMTAWDNMEKK